MCRNISYVKDVLFTQGHYELKRHSGFKILAIVQPLSRPFLIRARSPFVQFLCSPDLRLISQWRRLAPQNALQLRRSAKVSVFARDSSRHAQMANRGHLATHFSNHLYRWKT